MTLYHRDYGSLKNKRLFVPGCIILIIVLIILGVLMVRYTGFTVRSDGSNYYAYLRSVVFDRDLNFHNEFSRFDKAFWDTYKPKETITGHYTNVFSVGPAVLWAPFYLITHIIVVIANALGAGFKADGFSAPYLMAVNIGSLIYSFAGIYLVFLLCRKYFGRWVSLTASLTAWLATFITFYTVYQPYMSHTVSFFTVTLFVYYWHSTRSARSLSQWALLGLLAGLMMLVRWQNALFMIIPALESILLYMKYISYKNSRSIKYLLGSNLVFLLLVVIGFLPQMIAWKVIYGSFLTLPQGSGFLRWGNPCLSEILFSSRHGLFSWTPVTYIAAAGWFLLYKKDRFLAISGLIAITLMAYVNSVVSDWWAGWGFGMRRFDGIIVFIALGVAAVIDRIKKVSPITSAISGIIILVVFTSFNWFLMSKTGNTIHPGGPVAFNQVFGLSDKGIYKYTGYPFSIPANLIFSLRYSLSPARYDTLVGGYIDDPCFYGDTIKFEGASPLLGSGWSQPNTVQSSPARKITASPSIVFIPIRTVTGFEMTVSGISAKTSTVKAALKLNGQTLCDIMLQPKWQQISYKISANRLRPGINKLEFFAPPESFAVNKIGFKRLEPVSDWK
jgi:hypothetical protein